VRRHNGHTSDEGGTRDVHDDHEPALVEAVHDHPRERSEEDVRQRVEGEDGARPEGGPGALVDEDRERERRQSIADLGDELARPEQEEVALAVERLQAT
jgi:hypothetical protein